MSTCRRTFRTAAITAAVGGAMLIPAAGAFADAPAPASSETAGASPTASPAQNNDEAQKNDQGQKGQGQKSGARTLTSTVKLADKVSVAKVYKLGQNHYQADIIANGTKIDTLDANGKAAYGQNNGLHVALQPDGHIKSWVEGGAAKGKGQAQKNDQGQKGQGQKSGARTLTSTVKLADKVSVAKVYKLGQNHYQADIIANGTKIDTLDANGKAAYGQNNGLHVALQPDGHIKSWVEGGAAKGKGSAAVPSHGGKVPRGGVKAGAEGVDAGGSPELVAAGGGIAAAGAAGLGFMMLRRNRAQG